MFSASPEQARDTGMALTLLCLLGVYFWEVQTLVPAALVILGLTMVWPRAFRPLAGLWFGFSHLLGTIMSRVILTVLFFGLVTPIGLLRRALGADVLQLKKWKKGQESVFQVRGQLVTPKDLQAPY
uniref:SxtJ n=1 Tax=Desulfobacca acetoxidans TaxID=60893 RepID=A0A7C5AMD3_9BACT